MMKDEKMFRMARLLVRVVEGCATVEERREVEVWLEGRREREALMERLCDGKGLKRRMERYREIDVRGACNEFLVRKERWEEERMAGVVGTKEKVLEMVRGGETSGYEGKGRMRRMGGWWRWVAAVAVLLMVAGAWLLMVGEREVMDGRKGEVVLAGGEMGGARLRLSSGEVVDLEAGRGVLSETDGTVIKRDERGGLRYGNEGKSEVTKAEGRKKELIYNVLEVETGGEYYIELSDGTGVWLGACSRLRYPVRFGEGERVLWLEGEAFFEVARDEGRPFTVYAGDLAVEALGTSFNVKSYADDDFSHATLRSGRVRVTVGKDGSGGEVVLEPGEQALWEGGRMTRREVNVEVYTAWMGDAFCFERERLEDIMKSVARWYGVEVFFTSEELKGYHFGGRVPKYADVGEALGLLELTTDVRFEVKGRTVTVTRGDRGGGD